MKRVFLVLLLALIAFASDLQAEGPFKTKFGELIFKKGLATLGATSLNSNAAFSGLTNVDLYNEELWAGSRLNHQNEIVLLRFLADDSSRAELARGYVILDLRGSEPIISNAVNLEKKYVWTDNHYVKFDGEWLYFGLYVVDPVNPSMNSGGTKDRVQFKYANSRLEVENGKWMGPPKPERYIVPEESKRGPCFNVANVPECIQEVERDEARKRRKRSTPPKHAVAASAPASAASR